MHRRTAQGEGYENSESPSGMGHRLASAYGSSLTAAMTTERGSRCARGLSALAATPSVTDRIADYGDGRFGSLSVETGFAKQLGGSVGVEGGGP